MERGVNIEDIIREGEGYLVEFKESPAHLEEGISAFANASGGSIYIGISDKGEVKPIPLTGRLKAQLTAAVRNCDPPPDVRIERMGKIVVLKVSESRNKPVRAPRGFYLRIGATSQKLTRDEIFSFAVRESRVLFDSQLFVEKTAGACLSVRQIEIFRNRARLDIELDNLQLLENLGCVKYQNNHPYLTYTGILLFGKDTQRIFPQATITALSMENPSTILEQKIIKGTLFEQVEGCFAFLKSHLRSRPDIKSLRRKDILEFPEFVLRELLVNSVIHRDYFERSADIMVKIFKTHIEFCNPGTVSQNIPLKSLFGRSYRRNPMLADLFFHANYIERAGTGLLRVQDALKQERLPPLKLSEEGPFFVATLIRRESLETGCQLNARQRQVLTLPQNFFPFSTMDYAAKFGISERSARMDIRKLAGEGILIPTKDGRRVRYNCNR